MVNDAYDVLGLSADADDEMIRRRYLELVRQFTPDRQPEKFAQVRAAYESLRDLNTRLRHRLFEHGRRETIDVLIGEVACRSQRRRVSLETLLQVVQARH
jgi:curved DNA-binding protein CbpA